MISPGSAEGMAAALATGSIGIYRLEDAYRVLELLAHLPEDVPERDEIAACAAHITGVIDEVRDTAVWRELEVRAKRERGSSCAWC